MLPVDMARFRRAEAAFRQSCLRAGYSEVRTPTLEYLYLFTSAGTLTPGMLRRVYSFLDWDGWSGERVVLKPDATIPVARLYLEQMDKEMPARLFYVTNTFIFEETGTKPRERWQCGAELIGAGSPLADADLAMLSLAVLRALGIKDLELRLSHAGLIRAALSGLGLNPEEQHNLFDRILDKGSGALSGIATDSPQGLEAVRLLFGTRGESAGYLRNMRSLSSGSAEYRAALDDFTRVFELVEALGVPCSVDMTAGKGFEYYTGLIFRLNAGDANIGGGGRYDNLISVMGGEPTPAAGFALYMDKLMSLQSPDGLEAVDKVAVSCPQEIFKAGAALLAELRQSGIAAELALGSPSGCGWTVEVEAPGRLVLSGGGEKSVCASAAEIKKRLGYT